MLLEERLGSTQPPGRQGTGRRSMYGAPEWLRRARALWVTACAALRLAVRSPVMRELCCLVLLAVITAWFQVEALRQGRLFYEEDTRIFYFPVIARLAELLKQGRLPLWSPWIFGGYPLFADGEAGTLYPPHLIALRLWPVEQAFVYLRILRFVLAGLCMFAFVRACGLGRFAALVGGLTFALGGFSVAQLHHMNIANSSVWLPLVLACIELGLRRTHARRYGYFVCGGLALGMMALAIHVQVVLMSLLVIGLYTAYRVLVGPVAGPAVAIPKGTALLASIACLLHRRLGFIRTHRLLAHAGTRHVVRGVRALSSSPLLRRLGTAACAGLGRAALAAAALTIVVGTGLGLAAVQLLPLYELGTFSFRGSGVPYQFATQYSMPAINLITLLFPFFFSEAGRYWGPWSLWEIAIYAGIMPLLLAMVGLVFRRHSQVLFFALLGVLALVLAQGEWSPWQIHRLIAELPGFSSLRAPGRFSYLFLVSVAVLAAHGAKWLSQNLRPVAGHAERKPLAPAVLLGLLLCLQVIAMALPVGLQVLDAYIETHKDLVMRVIVQPFMSLRGLDRRLTAEQVYYHLSYAFDLDQPKIYRQLALLLASVGLLIFWERLRALHWLWRIAIVGIVAVDLTAFARSFHPTMPLRDLWPSAGSTRFLAEHRGLWRVYSWPKTPDEPNRLLPLTMAEASGYASLQPQRHAEYTAIVEENENRLLDLFNVRYIVERAQFTPMPSFELTSYDVRRPLVNSTGRNPAAIASWRLNNVPASSLRIISVMRQSVEVPQGTRVAEVQVYDAGGARMILPVLAGVHTAEWAWEREDVKPRVQHQLARIASTVMQRDSRGREFPAHLYVGELDLGRQMTVTRVVFRFIHPTAQIQVFGMALYSMPTGEPSSLRVYSLTARGTERLKQVYEDEQVRVYENLSVLPRAFLVPSAIIERPGYGVLRRMAYGDFDPERVVLLEEPLDLTPYVPVELAEAQPVRMTRPDGTESTSDCGTVRVVRYESDTVRLEANATRPCLLLLTDLYYPGWKALVDGKEHRIYRADYLFRAVEVPAGRHTIDFIYRPASFQAGLAISLATTLLALSGLGLAAVGPARRLLGRIRARLHRAAASPTLTA